MVLCPHCGEQNFLSGDRCWACGKGMQAPEPSPPQEPSPLLEPAPPAEVAAETTAPEAPAPEPVPLPPTERPADLGPIPRQAAPAPRPPLLRVGPIIFQPPPRAGAQTSAPKPAELDASRLRDRPWLRPPVDESELPEVLGQLSEAAKRQFSVAIRIAIGVAVVLTVLSALNIQGVAIGPVLLAVVFALAAVKSKSRQGRGRR